MTEVKITWKNNTGAKVTIGWEDERAVAKPVDGDEDEDGKQQELHLAPSQSAWAQYEVGRQYSISLYKGGYPYEHTETFSNDKIIQLAEIFDSLDGAAGVTEED